MKKAVLYSVCLMFVVSSLSFGVRQESQPSIFMDIDYSGVKYLYDKPGGRVIKKLKHDMEGEDFIVFSIIGRNDSMFHVKAYYSIKGYIADGWIKKDKRLGIYTRITPDRPLQLYSKPDAKSRIILTSGEYYVDMDNVIDSCGLWLKLRTVVKGKVYQGWIPPEMQCANVYSTCS